MRAIPTVVTYNPVAANAEARRYAGGVDCTGTAVFAGSENQIGFNATPPAGTVAGDLFGLHWTASAEL